MADPKAAVAGEIVDPGHTHDDIVEYPGVQYVYADVIRALITEVRRLRAGISRGTAGGDDDR